MKLQIVLFGSFGNFSVQVLDRLRNTDDYNVSAVVTTPPTPKGRHLHLTPNEVQVYSEKHNIPVYTPSDLHSSTLIISRPDFLVVAGYGKLIPKLWLDLPKIMAINMHPSLLPNYAGRCPAEWALLNGETETGVTLIKMTEKFDAGPILVQEKLAIDPDDTRLTLYTKLFALGAEMLITTLPRIIRKEFTLTPQSVSDNALYARQITRQDGYIPWEEFNSLLKSNDIILSTKFRAFYGWPGVWTTNPAGKRLKLVAIAPHPVILEEGKSILPKSDA